MKHILFSLGLLMCAASAQAQVTLEKRYNGFLEVTKLANGDVKYYLPEFTGNVLRVYNQDHSIFRSITVPNISGANLDYVGSVSDKMMNQDNQLEYVVFYRVFDATTQTGQSNMRIWNENGVQIAAADTIGGVAFYNTPTGTKMVASGSNYNSATGASTDVSRVYALGGTYIPLKAANGQSADLAQPYPNPATELVRLPYEVKAGEVATLRVYDAAGRVVRQFQVDNQFKHLALDARQLRAGVYVYRVESAAGQTPARRFVVR